MRRVLFVLVAALATAVAIPAVSLAQHHRKGGGHRSRVHRTRVRVRHWGKKDASRATSPSDTAGTVASFNNNVLTITLNDGSSVSGTVTDRTRLECESSSASAGGGEDNASGDEGQAANQDQPEGGDNQAESNGDQSEGDHGDEGQDNDTAEQDAEQSCTTAALTPGAVVREAELRVTSSGAVWSMVDIVQ